MIQRDLRTYRHTASQRGVSRAGFLVVLVSLIALGGFVWWATGRDPARPTPGATSILPRAVQEAVKNAKCDYVDSDVCKFFAARKATASYLVTATTEGAGQKSGTVLKKQTADTYYLKITGAGAHELINIGDTRYTKTTDNSWQKQPVSSADAGAATAVADPPLAEPTRNSQTGFSYKKVATETCGGGACFKYQVIDTANPKTTTHIWFSRDDYRLQRIRQTTSGVTTNALYSLESVSIAAPSPVQGAQPTQVLGQTGGAAALPRTGDE